MGRVQIDLVRWLATAFATYAAARQRAERYKTAVLPRAEQTYELSLRAYQGGQFEYLRSLAEAWWAGSDIAGLGATSPG